MTETLQVAINRRYGTLSPLRYPGGKATLAGLFEDILGHLEISSATYVEPYAGGAGAGVALLRQGLIDRLIINDIDPAVNAFWNSVLRSTERFIDYVAKVPLTVDEWRKHREIYRIGDPTNQFELGTAFFYLNRTNRSGILNAGVIGGLNQTAKDKIDARFNRETLTSRIQALGDHSEQIEVRNQDGRTIIREFSSDPNAFMYIDPPYVEAGSKLYLNAFEGRDHQALAAVVQEVDVAHWLMTYDVAPLIKRLYSSNYQCYLDLTYSANKKGRAQELLIASDGVAQALATLQEEASAVGTRAKG